MSEGHQKSILDYQKWDTLSQQIVNDERLEAQVKREKNMKEYMDQQKRSHPPHLEVTGKSEEKGPGHHGHTPTCGCGFADPAMLRKLQEERERNPPLPLRELNAKKFRAIEAAREHGGILFHDENYADAQQVYDRGVMIVQGMYGTTEEETRSLTSMEFLLELNIAACCLKQQKWQSAVDHCKAAEKLDKTNPKLYFRWAQALVGLAEYEEAQVAFASALLLSPGDTEIKKHLDKCVQQQKKAEASHEARMKLVAQKMVKK